MLQLVTTDEYAGDGGAVAGGQGPCTVYRVRLYEHNGQEEIDEVQRQVRTVQRSIGNGDVQRTGTGEVEDEVRCQDSNR